MTAYANRSPRIRVLLIAPSLEIVGGQAVQASRLLAVLQQAPELEITFFALNRPLPRLLSWLQRVPYVRTLVNIVFYNSGLLRLARKHDILHVFTAGLWSYTLWTVPALLIGKLYGKKLIINYRDGRAEQHLRNWRSARPTLRLADRIVVPSGYLVDVFAQYGIRAQSIFNMIDVDRFHYRKRRNLRPIFMTNRSLEPLYNVECILRAFALIQKRYPEASLTIAHDGICRPSLEKLAQELQLRNIRFIGKVPPAEIPKLYDSAEIYLTSPNIDCMPGSLLECFASGLPIVATKAGGIPYIAKDRESALLVDLNDHEAMAARAIELLENPDLVERITAGGREEIKRYLPEQVKAHWIALYQELLRQ
jgi:glycosyltransferase involved in cell wall biosynthesis